MPPALAVADHGDARLADPESLGQLEQRPSFVAQSADIEHLRFSQDCGSVGLAADSLRMLREPIIRAAAKAFRVSSATVAVIGQHRRVALRPVATLRRRVELVVGVRTEEQVIWPDASRNVARMANRDAFRDWPGLERVRHSVSEHRLAANPCAERAVTECIAGTCPQPTTISVGRIDLAPKPLGGAIPALRHRSIILRRWRVKRRG